LARVGFCRAELNPFGPVHEYVAPATVGVDNAMVAPEQYGPPFEAVGVAGTPVPESGTSVSPKFEDTFNVAVLLPADVGVNVTSMTVNDPPPGIVVTVGELTLNCDASGPVIANGTFSVIAAELLFCIPIDGLVILLVPTTTLPIATGFGDTLGGIATSPSVQSENEETPLIVACVVVGVVVGLSTVTVAPFFLKNL